MEYMTMTAVTFKLFSATFLLTLLSACGGDKPSTKATEKTSTAPTSQPATQGKVYKVGINTPYPPYAQNSDTGNYEGFDIDILNEIGKREGFTIDWQPRVWEGIYELLDTGELDIVASGGFDTAERRAKYGFSQPYHTETMVLITKNPDTKTFNDARGKSISYVVGGAEEYIVRDLTGSQELDPSLGNDSSWSSVKRIIQGKADFALDTSSIYAYYAKQYPDQKLLAIHQASPEISTVAFGVKKDNTELLNKLNNGLNAMKADGTYDKMKAKWFDTTAITTEVAK